ncbi:MAG: FMN-binding negative transcriptional regulator [Flavisolibacter sp.]
MYIPKYYLEENWQEIISFMKQYSFATIVTSQDNVPTATHLPFTITQNNDQLILTSHFARANEQWTHLPKSNSLVIFSEPHAYISPSHYEKILKVPTWNYISVHAYGKATIIEDPTHCIASLEEMIANFEPAYKKQWDSLPEDFKTKMLRGIVPFCMIVDDLQAKKKLSQNKTTSEQQKIIETLSHSALSTEKTIADYMQKNIQNKY